MAFEGMTFCITGTFSRKRSEFVKLLESHGGTFAKSMTKKVTHLLCSDDSESETTKYKKALERGLPIHDEEWVDEMIAMGGDVDDAAGVGGSGGASSAEPDEAASGDGGGDEEVSDDGGDGGAEAPDGLAGQVVCLTGKFSLVRSKVAEIIEEAGGEIAKSVTAKCTLLICEGDEGSSKWEKADSKGIPIEDEAWLRGVVGDEAFEAKKAKKKAPAKKKAAKKDADKPKKTKKRAAAGGGGGGDGPLSGMTFCITGTFSETRAKIGKLIEANGGSVAKSVTKAVTHLLCEGDEGSKKWQKADDKGIPIEDEEWLRGIIDGAEPDAKRRK